MANIIDDQLDGGPQWIENLGHDPVWVEDKSQLKREFEKRQLRPAVGSEKTPRPRPDDPRFYKNGRSVMVATPQAFQTASGLVGHRDTRIISRERMSVLAKAWDVLCDPLNGMGYQVVCPTCTRLFGEGRDGVKAENQPASNYLKIECGCTVHLYEAR